MKILQLCFKAVRLCCWAVLITLPLVSSAQVEMQKVAPLSPNAAAITKYGEIPVSQFTGIPGISVPVYNIQSKSLSLPLSLNYHAGGIKVEENASWVGLGWSLGSIPTISRQVNGLADDVGVGYHSNVSYEGLSMKEIEDGFPSATGQWIESFRRDIFYGNVDPEADVYSFSLPGKSGKFWWNQETNSYQTYPKSEIKIESGGGTDFKLTDEDGTVYIFLDYDLSQSSGSNTGPSTRSAWYATKIYNANKTDSISLYYRNLTASSTTLAPYTYTLFGSCPSSDLTFTTNITMKVPDSISFSNGYVKFVLQSTEREDYHGGYALDHIKVYNRSGDLISRQNFSYHYMQSTDNSGLCVTATSYEKKRLMLDYVEMVDASNITSSRHSFLYDSTIASPCKFSAAQDYWGFYNGRTSNSSLIPRTAVILTGGMPTVVGHANRNVDTSYSQFGILRRVIYPTGGHTDFAYENNLSTTPGLPAVYTMKSVALQGEAPDPITTDTYIDTFTVNNVADIHLNGNVAGAFLYAEIGAYGCDLSGGSSPCASFTIRGIDAGNSSYSGTVLPDNTQGWYVPNGRYEIKAHFNQTTPAYDEFWFMVSWLAFDSTQQSQSYNRNVGGLRAKRVISFDNSGQSITRQYKYVTSLASDTSSGEIFGRPYFVVQDNSWKTNGEQCFALHADPNAISVTHAGSYIGYGKVFEFIDTTGNHGYNEYHFTIVPEGIVSTSPYPPPSSQEYARGLQTLSASYRKSNGHYYPVRRDSSEYLLKTYDSLQSVSYKLRTVSPTFLGDNPNLYGIWEDAFYYSIPAWSGLSRKIERIYHQDDTTRFNDRITYYSYNSANQLSETKMISSTGDTIRTKPYYPADLSLSGSAETARTTLITQNNIAAVLKQETYKNSKLLNEIKTNYKLFGSQVMPEEIFQKIGSASSESRVKFLDYTADGNLKSQQKTKDVEEVYLWGYNGRYPVAKIINSTYATAVGYVNTSILNNPSSDAALRTELANLYNISNALVETYTYKPLIGVTSMTDARGRTTYYEYDSYNRLALVLDHDRNILKKYCYNYYGQPEDCGVVIYSNVAKSGNFTRSNCGTNGTGEVVAYNVAAGTYTSTISQTDADQKAQNDVNTNGQAYANANGSCTWTSQAQSGNFTRNNCGTNGTGSTVTYTIAAGTYSSTISLTDANQQAINAVNAGGQTYANANAGCTWTNQSQSGNFTRNNCGTNGTGSTVAYTIAAGTYSSTTSLADANQQAVNAVNAGGQAYANANAGCTWTNQAQSGNFTRNNCGTNGTGSTATFTINAGTYNSTVSLADANQQAVNAVNAGGQNYVNATGSCTWTSQQQSGSFTRNNCGTNGTGSVMTYYVNASAYSSTTSLADANQKAVNDVNTNGQAYVNANAGCTWTNQAQSGNFTRNNCASGGSGGTVAYNVGAGIYSSTTSLADANQKAVDAVNAGGQAYANANANCTWMNQEQNRRFERNNCPSGYTPSEVIYVIPANTHSSTVSQADANLLAYNAATTAGQAYANANGTCTLVIYGKLSYENYNYSYANAVHADVVVRFYSDLACTIPISVTSLSILLSTEGYDGTNYFSYDYPATVSSGSSYMVQASAELSYDDGWTTRYREYYLSAGTGYTVVF